MDYNYNELVYQCGSDKFREYIDQLEAKRIDYCGVEDFGILDAIIPDSSFKVLAFRDGRWMVLQALVHKESGWGCITLPFTLDFVLAHDLRTRLHAVLVSARLMTVDQCSSFMQELDQARDAAIEHQEREQLKKLLERYPEIAQEVS